ncbi:MAG: topoisomerase C-terminal repeat-containing protein, partial [Candidatus Nanopelagicales bacterium]
FTVSVVLGATATDGRDAQFRTTGTVITAPGFLAAYREDRDDDASEDERERRLPSLAAGAPLTLRSLEAEGHETQPPPRYTEASLIKALEERGIGRPSTYASIMGTILDRGYVWKRGMALVPSWIAFAVVTLLERHFGELVDYDFTARMEEVLDAVAAGDGDRLAALGGFYYGDVERDFRGLHPMVSGLGDIDARDINSLPIGDGVVLRVGRYGPYVERGNGDAVERGNVPDDIAPDELTVDKALELLTQPSGDRILGEEPETGRPIVAKSGRYGPYVTEVLPEDAPKSAKPRTASLLSTMSLDTVTLDEALRLLTLPRVVGLDPATGDQITAQNGRYGPYLLRGKDSRSLESESQLFTVTLDEALALYAQPKTRGRRAPAGPVRELGPDPVTGAPIVVRDGRFGPYVTDGETNATLRKADTVDGITVERAVDLLAEKRAKGPAPKKRTATKKTATKKS